MLAPRPSNEFKNKQNVNPSLDRLKEATAEDFKEASDLFNWFADWVDAQNNPEEFFGFHSSLSALQAAYPDAGNDSFAVIIPDNGNEPFVAIMQNGTWTAQQVEAPIQFAQNKVTLEENDGQADVFYVVTDEKLLALWYNNKYNYFGKDGDNGLDAYQVWLALGNTGDENDFFASIGVKFDAEVSAANAKTTPADADLFGILDSAANFVTKKLSWVNLKASLKTYFDTLYEPKGSGGGGGYTKPADYTDMDNLYTNQGYQETEVTYRVEDASAHPDITHSGWAEFEYLGTTNGDETDYELRDQEDFDTPGSGSGIQNINRGTFTGELDFSDGNLGYYDFYIGAALGQLTMSTTKVSGTTAEVDIPGDKIQDVNNFFPAGTGSFQIRKSGPPLTTDPAKINELTFMYRNDALKVVNRIFDNISYVSPFVAWENNLTTATYEGNGTIGTPTGAGGWTSGAFANRSINGNNAISATTDGSYAVIFGLVNDYEPISPSDISRDILIVLRTNGTFQVLEQGVSQLDTTGYTPGDTATLRLNNGTITFEVNGTVLYTSGLSLALPITPIALFNSSGVNSKLINAEFENTANLTATTF